MARNNNNKKTKVTTRETKAKKNGTNGGTTSKTKKPAASGTLTSSRWTPISKRTYELETKRKGTTKGYRKTNGKYEKEFKTTWTVERKKEGGKSVSRRKK